MVTAVSLSTYTIRVYEKNKQKPLALEHFDGKHSVKLEIIKTISDYVGKPQTVGDILRRLKISEGFKQNGTTFHGIAEVGNFGFTSSLQDVKTGKENYKRKNTDAEMMPLYTRFSFPAGKEFALCAFQNFGEIGCKTLLTELLLDSFKNKFPQYSLRFAEAAPATLLNDLIDKTYISKLRFVHHGVPSDLANRYGGEPLDPKAGHVELVIRAVRDNDLGIKKVVKGWLNQAKFDPKGVIEFEGMRPHELKVVLRTPEGREKTVRVSDLIKLRSRIDVTEDVEYDPATGHPKFDSISSQAADLLGILAGDLA